MNIFKRINEDYLYAVDEAHGVMSTSDSKYDIFVKRIVDDAQKYFWNYKKFGYELTQEDIDNLNPIWDKLEHKEQLRKCVYTDTGLEWLPELIVYFAGEELHVVYGMSFDYSKPPAIFIQAIQYYKPNELYGIVSHELKHVHTRLVDKKNDRSDEAIKTTRNWRSKDVSIDFIETKLYKLCQNHNILTKLGISETMRPKFMMHFEDEEQIFKSILQAMYYLQRTEMKSYLESFYSEMKNMVQKPNNAFSVTSKTNMYYTIYEQLYLSFKRILSMNTKELSEMHGNLLGILSMKVCAMKHNRDVRDDEPTDLSVWIEYKLKQIEQWLRKANSITIELIEREKNSTGEFALVVNGKHFKIKSRLIDAINFLKIIKRITKDCSLWDFPQGG